MTRRRWQETFSRDPEHVARLAAALIREEVAFGITPRPDGWWRIRADLAHGSLDPKPLEVLGQMTRTGPVEAFGPTR